MRARTITTLSLHQSKNRQIDEKDYHAVIKGDEITHHLPIMYNSPLSEAEGDYLVLVKGKLTEVGQEIIDELKISLGIQAYDEDESLDIPTDSDFE